MSTDPTTLFRLSDPDTSAEAAAKQPLKVEIVRAMVHAILLENGPMTHDQIIAWYNRRLAMGEDLPIVSPSSIRTRTSELVRAGVVVRVEGRRARSSMGNSARLWAAAEDQDEAPE